MPSRVRELSNVCCTAQMPNWQNHIVLVTEAITILPCVCLAVRGPGRREQHHGITRRLCWPPPLQALSCKRLDFLLMTPPPAEKDYPVCLSVSLSGWNFTTTTSLQPPARCWRAQEPRSPSSSPSSILWVWLFPPSHSTGSAGSPWNNRLETPQWREVDTQHLAALAHLCFKTPQAGKQVERKFIGKKKQKKKRESLDVQIVYLQFVYSFTLYSLCLANINVGFWPLNMFPFYMRIY